MSESQQTPSTGERSLVLLGCGILHKEVDALIAKNGWPLKTRYLTSALHYRLNHLSTKLDAALDDAECANQDTIVLYGECHPQMSCILDRHCTLRTEGQNCIVQLIGYDLFMKELSRGAYFLLEDWARTWEPMISATFGNHLEVMREIFHSSHKCLLAIRTPCSSDFTAAAEAAARFVDLPLEWMDVNLDHLESVLADAITRKQQQLGRPPRG